MIILSPMHGDLNPPNQSACIAAFRLYLVRTVGRAGNKTRHIRDNAVSIYRAAKRLLDANDTFPRTHDELEFAVRLREVSDAVTNLRVALAEAEKTS
jgi:hypothetical protein